MDVDLVADIPVGCVACYRLARSQDRPVQVPDLMRKCVAFLAYEDVAGIHMAGTGFFVSIPVQHHNAFFVYLVTARHVIANASKKSVDDSILIRINTKEGGFDYVKVSANLWMHHDDDSSVDLAALVWAPDLRYEYRHVGIDLFVDEKVISDQNVGLGDDLFIIGLFASHLGRQRNIPVCRAGNIASMPEERISTRYFGDMEAYIIESRSIGGLSGSPVFLYISSSRIVMEEGKLQNKIGHPTMIRLLGVIHGHWDVLEDKVADEIGRTEGKINMGMAIVTPSSKIMELLNKPSLVEYRNKRIQQMNQASSPAED